MRAQIMSCHEFGMHIFLPQRARQQLRGHPRSACRPQLGGICAELLLQHARSGHRMESPRRLACEYRPLGRWLIPAGMRMPSRMQGGRPSCFHFRCVSFSVLPRPRPQSGSDLATVNFFLVLTVEFFLEITASSLNMRSAASFVNMRTSKWCLSRREHHPSQSPTAKQYPAHDVFAAPVRDFRRFRVRHGQEGRASASRVSSGTAHVDVCCECEKHAIDDHHAVFVCACVSCTQGTHLAVVCRRGACRLCRLFRISRHQTSLHRARCHRWLCRPRVSRCCHLQAAIRPERGRRRPRCGGDDPVRRMSLESLAS